MPFRELPEHPQDSMYESVPGADQLSKLWNWPPLYARTRTPMQLGTDPGPTAVCARCGCTVATLLWSAHVQWHSELEGRPFV